uniref:uncharacterized protein LOC100177288 isoform X2 n=1 Tax=Ciona intestinalis TaxID=7719 RepID=UPI000EF44F23|nr:uncharacterized protein LOC100177288 isoform X2 [Ciona intestinalis]|eukprot:XP_026695303.1 uncharacterized protein LOC100177288 isoform X2 [Ciona intestinalis]
MDMKLLLEGNTRIRHGNPHQSSAVNAQAAFTFSALSLQPPISSVGSTATATCNVTYTGSTTSILTWKINDVVVGQYRIKNNEVPQYANLASGYDTSSSTTTSIVNTGDTFPMSLEIRNVNLTLNQATVSLGCSVPGCITQVQLHIKECSSPTPNNVPVNPSSGVYNTQANFQCSHGSTLFNMNGTTGNTATKCLATAEWENEKIVQCWSAPTATLIGNITICAGNIATFQCTATGGFPSLDRVEIYFRNQKQTLVGNTWTSNPLSSSNNGDIVECRAINSYTAMQEYSNLGRDNKTLIVHYTAKNPKFETKFTDLLINSSSGYLLRSDETLTMNCSADGNPAVTCTWSCSPTNCGSLPNTCGINNVNVVGSTTITCAVGNGVCGGGTTSITHHITVVAITRVLYMVVDGTTTTASSITRNKTESLSLACGIQNQNEMNTLIVWKKDGFVRSIGSLYIPSVASSDDGLYVCETSDPFGNFSTSVSLTVLYPAEQFQITNGLGTLCEWGTVGPQYCNITFSLNPVTHSAILKKNGLIADNDFKYKPQSTNIQNYVFMKNQPTQNDTGSYTLTVTSSTFTPVIFSFTVLVSNPFVVPKDNTATIVGAVLGSIISILLIIIAFLVVKLYRKKKPETSHPRSEGNTNTAADDYVELNQPTNRSHTSQPVVRSQQSTNYENLKNNVNVTRDEQGYADIQGVGPSVATTLNDGYETFIGRKYENTAGQSSSK